ncbi:MAG: cobalt-factor II C(20)-methyltransferase [Halobacteria archaeon]|nr:cobalt-factor II C(20)-methyltransferase [Halobacteria archaeon]
MTVYGVGLGPGRKDLLTIGGREALEDADVVYTPGRLSKRVVTEYVSEDKIGDLDFPMTRDPEKLREAWKEAADEVASTAEDQDAAFATLGDPNIYSTFGHLRRTLDAFHPEVDVEIIPGVSSVTAFATALGVEIEAGSSLGLHEASDGDAPTENDRMVLFKVTDAPETATKLDDAGYDVVFGRRLYMEEGDTVVTEDPERVEERDYYTLAYAERRGVEKDTATKEFETQNDDENTKRTKTETETETETEAA